MMVSGKNGIQPKVVSNYFLRFLLCFMVGAGNQYAVAAQGSNVSKKQYQKMQSHFDKQKIADQKTLKSIVLDSSADRKKESLAAFIHEKAGILAAVKSELEKSSDKLNTSEAEVALAEIRHQADYYAGMMRDLTGLNELEDLNAFADQLAQDNHSAFFLELFLIVCFGFLLAAIFSPSYYYTYTPVTVFYDKDGDRFYYYRGYRRVVYL